MALFNRLHPLTTPIVQTPTTLVPIAIPHTLDTRICTRPRLRQQNDSCPFHGHKRQPNNHNQIMLPKSRAKKCNHDCANPNDVHAMFGPLCVIHVHLHATMVVTTKETALTPALSTKNCLCAQEQSKMFNKTQHTMEQKANAHIRSSKYKTHEPDESNTLHLPCMKNEDLRNTT